MQISQSHEVTVHLEPAEVEPMLIGGLQPDEAADWALRKATVHCALNGRASSSQCRGSEIICAMTLEKTSDDEEFEATFHCSSENCYTEGAVNYAANGLANRVKNIRERYDELRRSANVL